MIIKIGRETPLIGCIAFGIVDRGTDLLQIRATTLCNINCTFCSVDGGNKSTWHKNFYTVDLDYLIEETNKVIEFKETAVEINIDSVGEPFCYPKLEELVKRLRENSKVKKISIQTNGTIDKDVDVDVLNISLHAMDPKMAKDLADSPCYDIQKLKDLIKKYLDKGREVRFCPVWLPGINDEEIPKIIAYAKELGCTLGIQKYEAYRYSRKPKKVKPLNWYKFFKQIEKWEKEFDIELKLKAVDFDIHRAKRIPEVFKKGDKIQVEIVQPGWIKGQMIGKAKNRVISINECNREIGDKVNVTMLETKNNIYLAQWNI
jgi:uncharacterized protein